jgi:two-component system, LytTR family, sensor histidine kinase AgrC
MECYQKLQTADVHSYTISLNSGKYQSTKTESGRHGYGLNSIARIAEKYQGEILVEAQDSVFFLTVVMNLPEN